MNGPTKTAFLHYHLKAETIIDQYGPAVMLTQQDDIQDPMSIVVHPWQLRAACEHLGIVHADPAALRETAALTRRLRALVERIEHLNNYLHTYSDSEHANLSYEQTYSQATADLAAEFCLELDSCCSAPEGCDAQSQAPKQGTLL